MVNSHFLKKIISVGEKDIMSRLVDYTELAYKESDILIDMLSNRNSLVEKNEEIKEIEKVGDELDISIRQDVTKGAISPTLMNSMLQLVEKCDDIIDTGYFISREIKRMFLDYAGGMEKCINLVTKTYSTFISMLEYNKASLKHLNQMLTASEDEKIRDERIAIEKLEEKVDELKDDTFDYIYRNADGLPYLVFSHLIDLTHKIDDMLDDCEDAADLIITITRSITS
ncbi:MULTISPECIES: DUF47 family protein [unclassified Thermoplasma]|uniref:DUF47 family protein n=1 Tax=unclassified Thermoplasma TaxID=2684908 RepID=UPI001F18873D|nr:MULTISPECIES: DUF47 family protein [unclassified Thermoplasma]